MNIASSDKQEQKKVLSKYLITVIVEAVIDYGMSTTVAYKKDVKFLIEPTAKKYKI